MLDEEGVDTADDEDRGSVGCLGGRLAAEFLSCLCRCWWLNGREA